MRLYNVLSSCDRERFRKFKWDRFEELVKLSGYTQTWQDCDSRLLIDCPDPASVDRVMARLDQIRQLTWQVLGADELGIFFVEEAIWQGTTRNDLSLESHSFEDSEMTTATATATAEKPTVTVQAAVQQKIVPAIDMAIDAELEIFATSGELEALISDRINEKVPTFLSRWLTSLSSARNGAVATLDAPPIAKSTTSSTPAAPEISLGANYSAALYNALVGWLPTLKEQQTMLTQIRRSTKKGTEFLDRLIALYPEPKREKARENMTNVATLDRTKARLLKNQK